MMRWVSRLTFLLLVLAVSAAALWAFRAHLLTAVARAWAVDDRVVKADAIVLLGGNLENRPSEAARLYQQGVAPIILVSCPENPGFVLAGYSPGEFSIALRMLGDAGVPSKAIIPMGTNLTSTYDEAVAFRQWADQAKPRSVVIPTDLFHTRRAGMVFRKVLGTNRVTIHPTVVPSRYRADDWWRHEKGLVDFNMEISKMLYYLLNY